MPILEKPLGGTLNAILPILCYTFYEVKVCISSPGFLIRSVEAQLDILYNLLQVENTTEDITTLNV